MDVENPVALKPGAVVSDVGSTKSEVCALGQKAFPPGGSGVFLGSHPMAGSEKTGVKARDAHLFENAAWIRSWDVHYAGNLGTDAAKKASSLLEKFVEGLGARTLFLAPNYHDYLIAYASHAPQLLSIALASVVRGVGGESGSADSVDILPQVVGGGFRDMTRLAASSFAVWEPILRSNKEFILDALKAYRQELESMEVALEESEGAEGLKPVFSEANALRARFNAPRKGFSSPTTEILVDLEDRPGELLKVLSPLSERKINVLDLEILKVREGEEGVLMMGFHKAEEAQAALDLLSKSGHQGEVALMQEELLESSVQVPTRDARLPR